MTHWIHHRLPDHDETNIVFFRGTSLDAITKWLLGLQREVLVYGGGTGWEFVMHDMHDWHQTNDDLVDYGQLSSPGCELVVLELEPNVMKGHRPSFEYRRSGHLISAFSFEMLDFRQGDEPDLLLPALTAANLAGPRKDVEEGDFEGRVAAAIAGFFSLPDPEGPPQRG